MTLHEVIVNEFIRVAGEQKKALSPLDDKIDLVSTGLDSLCFAIIVARLEDRLGADPFADEDIQYPVTFGDFVALYEARDLAAAFTG